MFERFDSTPADLFVFIGPSISQKNYEVGEQVANLFEEKYIKRISDKYFLDIVSLNRDILREFEIPEANIEISTLCSYEEKDLLHSYRRDRTQSGRSLGIIAMKSGL